MTGLAAILVRSSGKLPFVNIFVTVFALRLRDFKEGIFALRSFCNVAFSASDLRMMTLERIFCSRVIFHGKCGRLKTIHVVTRCTLSAIRPREELSFVRVLVAVHAFGERHRRLEVPVRVAIATSNGSVFAQQRIFCLCVIEAL